MSREIATRNTVVEGSIDYSYPTEQELDEAMQTCLTDEEYIEYRRAQSIMDNFPVQEKR